MNEADPDNNIFLVEKLLDRRWHKKRVEYLVKWLNFPDSENTWEPKANINPRLVDQYDNENGGPINGPPLKAPKTPKRATPQTTTSPSQRGRPRAPPKPRDETPSTSTRTRRRRTDAASETNISTASVDESVTSSKSEEPAPKKARVEKKPAEEKPAEDSTTTEVPIESGPEITPSETSTAEPSATFVDEVKIPTIELIDDSPDGTNDVPEKQPELIYEYEQAEVQTINTSQGTSTTTIEQTQVIIETPVDSTTNDGQQETSTFESVNYVVEEDNGGGAQLIQIHETSSTVTTANGANFVHVDQPDKSTVSSSQNIQQDLTSHPNSATMTNVSIDNVTVTIVEL